MAGLRTLLKTLRKAGLRAALARINHRFGLTALPAGSTSQTCPRPYYLVSIQSGGRVFCCCSGWVRLPLGRLRPSQDLNAVWNGRLARLFRKSMHRTRPGAVCKPEVCPYLIQDTLPRLVDGRLDLSEGRAMIFNGLQDNKALTEAMKSGATRLDFGPLRIDVDADPRCNLACRSCRRDHVRKITPREEALLDSLADIIETMGPRLHRLNLMGDGEPFYSPFSLRLLRTLSRETHPNLEILILTNGQLLTPELWETLQPGRELIATIGISIDAATRDTYETERRGATWNRLIEALNFTRSLRDEGAIKAFSINFVVSARNFREMPAFVRFGQRFGADSIIFTAIQPWNEMDADYREAAIHEPTHPGHRQLQDILTDPVFRDPRVRLGLLPPTRSQS